MKKAYELAFNILSYGKIIPTKSNHFYHSFNTPYTIEYNNTYYFIQVIHTRDDRIILNFAKDYQTDFCSKRLQPEQTVATVQVYPIPKKKEGVGRILAILRIKHKELINVISVYRSHIEIPIDKVYYICDRWPHESDIVKDRKRKTRERKWKRSKQKQKEKQRGNSND